MSESWTEYAVRYGYSRTAMTTPERNRDSAQLTAGWIKRQGWDDATLVGRTVIASDWLPVDGAQ